MTSWHKRRNAVILRVAQAVKMASREKGKNLKIGLMIGATLVVLSAGYGWSYWQDLELKAFHQQRKREQAERAAFDKQMQEIDQKKIQSLKNLDEQYKKEYSKKQTWEAIPSISTDPGYRIAAPPPSVPARYSPQVAPASASSSQQEYRDPDQWSDQKTLRVCSSARSYKRQTGRSALTDTANMGIWAPGAEIRNIFTNMSRVCPDAL